MCKNSFLHSFKAFFIILGLFCLIGCKSEFSDYEDVELRKQPPYVFTGEFKMIKVPVPDGGIDFPIGINDDQTVTQWYAILPV